MTQLNAHRLRYFTADLCSTAAGWLCFNVVRYFTLDIEKQFMSMQSFLTSRSVVAGQVLIPVCMTALYALSGSYNRSNTFYKSRLDEVLNCAFVSCVGTLGIWFTVLLNDSFQERLRNYELLAILFACLFIPVSVVRIILLRRECVHVRRGDYAIRTLAVNYNPDQKRRLEAVIASRPTSGLDIVGVTGVENPAGADIPFYGSDDIPALCRRLGIQAIVMLGTDSGMHEARTLNSLYSLGIPIFVTPRLLDMMSVRPRVSSVINEPLVDVTKAHISPAAANFKRLGDITVSAAALVALAPVFALLALLVKTSSEGPVFYTQTRIGRHRTPFRIIKFRTMYGGSEPDGPRLSGTDDPRVTKIGRILRRYHLDELPQFLNVLKGEMSLVGPRPEREYYLRMMLDRAPASSLLFQMRPGLTSWGMVKYGYASDVDQMIERLYYDLLYLENVSLGTDLKILCHTVDAVLKGRGK